MGHLLAPQHEHSVPTGMETRVLKPTVRTVRCDDVTCFTFLIPLLFSV
jgi:hypothetical protein